MAHAHTPRLARRTVAFLALAYLIAWALMVAAFWLTPDRSGSMAFGYALFVIWLVMPVLTFAVSAAAGRLVEGAAAWVVIPALGVMFMLLPYVTYSLANTLSFGNVHVPDARDFLVGAVCSAAGVLLGRVLAARRLRAAAPSHSA